MTDTLAIMLSIMLLYYYLKNNIFVTILITLLLAFTWRVGFYQALLLIALPPNFQNFSFVSAQQKKIITTGAIFYALVSILFYIYIQKQEISIPQVARIDRTLLPLSIIGVAVVFAFMCRIFYNTKILDINSFFQKLNYKRIVFAIGTYAIVYTIVHLLKPYPQSRYATA